MTHHFEVWAPRAGRVEIGLGSGAERLEMDAAGQGWWRAVLEDAGAGTRYRFSLDGGPLMPDPRSPHQPDGVHGASEVVDHDAFAWNDAAWRGIALQGTLIYELHVGTFSAEGTFDGVATHLDHILDLGVDAIEVMPVAEFPGRWGWGYDGVDLYAPHHLYGGPGGLKRLVDTCHERGLGVIMDVVYNHLGPDGNYLAEFGPYFSEVQGTAWGQAVNLDGPDSDPVRRFLIDNALMWLRDYHCDGLRIDAVHAITDRSPLHILEELSVEVEALSCQVRRPLFLIAESDDNDPRIVRDRTCGGYGIDAVWADDWHHALHAALTGERDGYYRDFGGLALVAKTLRQAWAYDGVRSEHRRRRHGRSPAGIPLSRFVVFDQNHDQVGNRAAGDRLGHLATKSKLKIAAALLLTSPFTPLLFQGEEWAASAPFQYFTDYDDPELGKAVSHGRRREFSSFGWDPDDVPDPQDPETFWRSRLDWAEVGEPAHRDVLDWYRELIRLRRSLPAITDPCSVPVVEHDEAAGWITLRRGRVLVAANPSTCPVALGDTGPHRVLASSEGPPTAAEGRQRLELAAESVVVVELESSG